MRLNQTSELKLMTIWISWVLPFFSFDLLHISWATIVHPSEKLWPFEFLESFPCSFPSVSIYPGCHTCTRVKIYAQLNLPRASFFNFECLNILCVWIWHPSEKLWPFKFFETFYFFNFEYPDISLALIIRPSQKLWPFEFVESFHVQFRVSWYMMRLSHTQE